MYSNAILWNALIYDSDNSKVVFIWNNQSNEIRSCTGDVNSDDTLTLGSTVEITSDNPATLGAVYYTSESKMVVVFANAFTRVISYIILLDHILEQIRQLGLLHPSLLIQELTLR